MLIYKRMQKQAEFSREDLEAIGRYGTGFSKLALPFYPILMVDYTKIFGTPGVQKLPLSAEGRKDIYEHDWFFKAHFVDDPVMPGCLTVEGTWQFLSFLAVWYLVQDGGHTRLSEECTNRARVLRSSNVKFKDQVLPHDDYITYHGTLREIMARNVKRGDKSYPIYMAVGDASVRDSSGKESCSVSDVIIRFGPLFDEDYSS